MLADVGRLEVRDVPDPNPGPRDVLLRVAATGLCGTDLHIFAGHANYNRDTGGRTIALAAQPQILGHEITGVVEQLGADVRATSARPGDRVIVDQGRNCVSAGRAPLCEYCNSGDSHQCEFYREHGITGLPGGMAEYVSVPAVNTVRIESGLDTLAAALTEPLACVVHSSDLLRRAPARYPFLDTGGVRCVVICGAGPAGLLWLQYLRRVLGFDGLLLVSEPNRVKRALAERLGGETMDPGDSDVAELVQDRTHGRRAELVIEATGSGSVFAGVHRLLRKQGTVVLYGHGHAGVDLSVLNELQFREPTLLSPVGASGGFEPDGRPSTYVRALRLIEAGRIDVASLITHRYPALDTVARAFTTDYAAPDYVKGVLLLEEEG